MNFVLVEPAIYDRPVSIVKCQGMYRAGEWYDNTFKVWPEPLPEDRGSWRTTFRETPNRTLQNSKGASESFKKHGDGDDSE